MVALVRLGPDQQQRSNALEVLQLFRVLEPLAGIDIRRWTAVGYAPRFDGLKSMLLQQPDVFGFRARLYRDFKFVAPAQRIVIVGVEVDENEQLSARRHHTANLVQRLPLVGVVIERLDRKDFVE